MKSKIRSFSTVYFAVSLITGYAVQAKGTEDPAATQGKNAYILNQIHHANQKEINAGQTALNKAQSADVKEFAQHMIDQHKDADQKVMDLAKAKKVELVPFQMADYEKVASDALDKLQGERFDRAYMGEMKSGHEEVLFNLKSDKDMSKDDQVNGLIDTLKPAVEMHEKMAEKICSKLKGKG